MPLTPSPAAGPPRRSMLAGALSTLGPLGALAALGTTTGCSQDRESADAAHAARTEDRLRQAAAKQSGELLKRYEATLAAHAGLADRLRPLRATTVRHAEALGGKDAARRRGGSGASGEQEKDSNGKGSKDAAAVPGDEKAALAALGEAERRTAEEREAALAGAPPELARLLASLAAAGAVHAYLLGADEQDGEDDDA